MSAVAQQFTNVGAQWTTGVSPARSLPGPVTVGSRVSVVTSFGDGGGSATVTDIQDAAGTVYTLCKRQPDATLGIVLEIWSGIAAATNAGNSVVVTQSATGASTDDFIGLYEITVPNASQVFDATNTNGVAGPGGITVHDSGNVTTVSAGAVLIGGSRGGSGDYTPDPAYTAQIDNTRSTLAYLQQVNAGVDNYVVNSVDPEFVSLIIVAFEAAGGPAAPIITNVDGDNIITSTQQNWPINGTGFDDATVEIRQGAVEIPQVVYMGQTDTQINCDTVFDPGAPGNGPHLKYGVADAFVINADLSEASIPITVVVPAGRSFVDVVDPNPIADNRITAVADLATGDQLEISNVVGGGIGDVTVNPDATFDCAENVVSFEVRCWDATDQTWGAPGTQTPGGSPTGVGGVEGPSVEGPLGVVGSGVTG